VFLAVKQPSRLNPIRPDRQVPEIPKLQFLVAHKQMSYSSVSLGRQNRTNFLKENLLEKLEKTFFGDTVKYAFSQAWTT
jgi:hypothetical protein